MQSLRVLSYLAPSIPEELFELLAGELEAATGVPIELAFERRVSGPSPEDDPFAAHRADLAFVCAPSYPALKEAGSPVVLLPAAPVFDDPRAGGRPVYYSDVVVPSGRSAERFEDLAGTAVPEPLRDRIVGALLRLEENPAARERLAEFGLRGFAPVEETTYASSPSMASALPRAVRMV